MLPQGLTVAVTLKAIDNMSRVVQSATNNAANRLQALGKRVSDVSSKMRAVSTAVVGTGLVMSAALAAPTKTAMDFESAMTGLGKQAGVTRDAYGKMTTAGSKVMAGLTNQVFALSREIPYTAVEIAGMMEAGARMGVVGESNLAAFTRQTAMMAAAFDVADPARLAEDFGKLGNVLDIPINQMGGLADVINYLDDQTLAKGGDIIEVLTRVGGTARQLGMAKEQTAALATAFLSLGKAPETAATASAALLTKLATAPMRPDTFQAGLKELNLNDNALNLIMTSDPQKGLLQVLDKINALPKNRQVIVGARLFGAEFGDEAAALAQSVDKYREIIALSQSTEALGSMQREFNARMQDTANQLKIAGNMASILAIKFGTLFLPLVSQALSFITPLIDRLTQWVDANPTLARNIGLVAAAVAGVLVVGGTFLALLGSVGGAIGGGLGMLANFARGLGTVAKHVRTAGTWLRNLYVAATILASVTPVGWIIGIGVALAAAAVLVFKYWKPIAGFFRGLWRGLGEGLAPVVAAIMPAFAAIGNALRPLLAPIQAAWGWITRLLQPVEDVGGAAENMGVRWGRVIGQMLATLVGLPGQFLTAAGNIVNAIVQGINSKAGEAWGAMKNLTAGLRAYLPFSPAKAGALRDIHRIRLVETIAAGVKPAPLVNAMARVAVATRQAISPAVRNGLAPAAAGAAGRAGGAAVSIDFSPHIDARGAASGVESNILSQLQGMKHELRKMVEDAVASRNRTKFERGN